MPLFSLFFTTVLLVVDFLEDLHKGIEMEVEVLVGELNTSLLEQQQHR